MSDKYDEVTAYWGDVHFSWARDEDGTWGCRMMWGRTNRSGRMVEKTLDHLVPGRFSSEAECRAALELAAKAWLHEHQS